MEAQTRSLTKTYLVQKIKKNRIHCLLFMNPQSKIFKFGKETVLVLIVLALITSQSFSSIFRNVCYLQKQHPNKNKTTVLHT